MGPLEAESYINRLLTRIQHKQFNINDATYPAYQLVHARYQLPQVAHANKKRDSMISLEFVAFFIPWIVFSVLAMHWLAKFI